MTAKWQYRQAYESAVDETQRLKAENERLKERLAQYGLFSEIVGDPAHEFASLRRELHRVEHENSKLRESVRNLLTCVKHEECEESCPHYSPTYSTYGHDSHGSIVVEDEYLGCCLVGLENCNSMLFNTDEYLRELRIEVE